MDKDIMALCIIVAERLIKKHWFWKTIGSRPFLWVALFRIKTILPLQYFKSFKSGSVFKPDGSISTNIYSLKLCIASFSLNVWVYTVKTLFNEIMISNNDDDVVYECDPFTYAHRVNSIYCKEGLHYFLPSLLFAYPGWPLYKVHTDTYI